MMTWFVRKKDISGAGLRAIWKTKKYFILDKVVKPLILNKIEFFGTTKKKMYEIDRRYCIETLWGIYQEKVAVTQFMWHK